MKKIHSTLRIGTDEYPFPYFLGLFIIFFISYEMFLTFYLRFVDMQKMPTSIGWQNVFLVVYNTLIASASFIFYKKLIIKKRGKGL